MFKGTRFCSTQLLEPNGTVLPPPLAVSQVVLAQHVAFVEAPRLLLQQCRRLLQQRHRRHHHRQLPLGREEATADNHGAATPPAQDEATPEEDEPPPPPPPPAPHVVELGCGSAALGGLAAAASGLRATVTDLPEVLRLARKTLRRNGDAFGAAPAAVASVPLAWGDGPLPAGLACPAVTAAAAASSSSSAVSAAPRQQVVASNVEACSAEAARTTAARSSARSAARIAASNAARNAADLLVGADVLYRAELHLPLLATLRALCAASHAARVAEAQVEAEAVDETEEEAEDEAGAEAQGPESDITSEGAAGSAKAGPPCLPVACRVVLAYQSRHPLEEARFAGELAPAFGFAAASLGTDRLPGLGDWHRANVRLLQLTWRPAPGAKQAQ